MSVSCGSPIDNQSAHGCRVLEAANTLNSIYVYIYIYIYAHVYILYIYKIYARVKPSEIHNASRGIGRMIEVWRVNTLTFALLFRR